MTSDIATDRITRNEYAIHVTSIAHHYLCILSHKKRKIRAAGFPCWCVILSCMCFVFLALAIAAIIALAIGKDK